MTVKELLDKFLRVTEEKTDEGYPSSQYFWTSGTVVRIGFTCAGYHFWRSAPGHYDAEHFVIGPIQPLKGVSENKGKLMSCSVSRPFDEVKASMVTAKKLGVYWNMEGLVPCPFKDQLHWEDTIYLWIFDSGEVLWENSHRILWPYKTEPIGQGQLWAIHIPNGQVLDGCLASYMPKTKIGTPPLLVLSHEDYGGVIAVGRPSKDSKEQKIIKIGKREYELTRIAGNFTSARKENKEMNFNNLPDVGKAKAEKDAKISAEKVEKAPETTNIPVEPEKVEKPAVQSMPIGMLNYPDNVTTNTTESPAEGAENAEEAQTLKGQLEQVLRWVDDIKNTVSAMNKGLKPLIKEVAKLEKNSANPVELKEANAKIKALESEVARLKGAMKLLVNGEKF